MLLDAIIVTLFNVMNALVGLLPTTASLPTGIDGALSYFSPIWNSWTEILPFLSTLVSTIFLVITIEGFIFLYGGINWTLNKLRGSG